MSDESAARTTGAGNRRSLLFVAQATAVVVGVLVLAYLIYRVRSVAVLVFIGFFLAVGLDPLVSLLQRRMRRGFAVTLVFLGLLALLALLVGLVLRPAVVQLSQLVSQLPSRISNLQNRNGPLGDFLSQPKVRDAIQNGLTKLLGYVASSVGTIFSILAGVVTALFKLFTVVALTIYFMLALPRIRDFVHRALGRPERIGVAEDALAKVGGYVTGQLIISSCAGVFAFAFLEIAHAPYPVLLAIAVTLLDAIPQVGATAAAVLCTVVSLTDSVTKAAIVLVGILLYQQFENYVLSPRIFSKAVELSPVAVFVAVLVGGSLGGFVGALTALPVTAALKTVFRYVFRDRLADIERVDPAPGRAAADSAR